MITGLDDDGDAGSAWFIQASHKNYGIDKAVLRLLTSIQIQRGGENYGHSNSAIQFDFDFDGISDIMVGYNDETPWAAPLEQSCCSVSGMEHLKNQF